MSDNIYKTIVENLDIEIFVCDGEGNIVFVNPASIEINELNIDDVIGKNVRDLCEQGYFTESSSMRVMETGKEVSVLQTLKNGNTIVATGVPVYDEYGDISLIVSYSQDIEQVNKLIDTVDKQEEEIASLKEALFKDIDFDVNDPMSLKLKSDLEKVASLDMPLLLSGDSGTGKQVCARHVHFSGKRRDYPFITVDCSEIDDDMLDQEIFGCEELADDGVTKRLKQGKLDLAGEGTLVLRNIVNTSERFQNKLFEYLDTGSFIRYNGLDPIPGKARIIGLCGTDIKNLCKDGHFSKALYFKLNTVPFTIPPLASRPADIAYLANQYLNKCNNKYRSKKIFSRDAIGVLTSHSWPGNFIELKNRVESAYIMTDGPIIKRNVMYDSIHGSSSDGSSEYKVHCDDILPLKEAKNQLEEQLVKRAYAIYGTTHKTAEALGVNQSTVSRILRKY